MFLYFFFIHVFENNHLKIIFQNKFFSYNSTITNIEKIIFDIKTSNKEKICSKYLCLGSNKKVICIQINPNKILDKEWTSNESEIIRTTSVLSLNQNLENDQISLKISDKNSTKRSFLFILSYLLDAFGSIFSCTIQGKLFLQKLSEMKLGWDTIISKDLLAKLNVCAFFVSNLLSNNCCFNLFEIKQLY
jgi:hypothetical protein